MHIPNTKRVLDGGSAWPQLYRCSSAAQRHCVTKMKGKAAFVCCPCNKQTQIAWMWILWFGTVTYTLLTFNLADWQNTFTKITCLHVKEVRKFNFWPFSLLHCSFFFFFKKINILKVIPLWCHKGQWFAFLLGVGVSAACTTPPALQADVNISAKNTVSCYCSETYWTAVILLNAQRMFNF